MSNTPHQLGMPGWHPAMPDDTTIADDSTRSLPPSQQPPSVRAPRGKPPRWPRPGKSDARPHGSAYARNPGAQRPQVVQPPAGHDDTRDRRVLDAMHGIRARLPRFHVIHLVLLAGVGAMWLAIKQPWGSDAAGSPIYIDQFSIPQLSDQSVNIGQIALQTATWIAMAAVIMAGALLLVNIIYTLLRRGLHRLGISRLAGALFIPLFALLTLGILVDLALAAGFGGLSVLSQLPFVRDHGFASIGVANAAIGFYLWWFGIGATLIGALGEVFLDRR